MSDWKPFLFAQDKSGIFRQQECRSFPRDHRAMEEPATHYMWGVLTWRHFWMQLHWHFLLGCTIKEFCLARLGFGGDNGVQRMAYCPTHLQCLRQEEEAVAHCQSHATISFPKHKSDSLKTLHLYTQYEGLYDEHSSHWIPHLAE